MIFVTAIEHIGFSGPTQICNSIEEAEMKSVELINTRAFRVVYIEVSNGDRFSVKYFIFHPIPQYYKTELRNYRETNYRSWIGNTFVGGLDSPIQ